jgi:benzoyl-CoA reductase/2-hydroxyglutaryl-CoA dehydratase subunit BcrC/BadD/HgdB
VKRKILYISNYVPEEIVDLLRFEVFDPVLRIDHFCTYVLNFISRIIYDDSIDGGVFANSCDSIRTARELTANRTDKFIHQIKHPFIFSEESLQFYASEIQLFKEHFESHFNTIITESEIEKRIQMLDERNCFIRKHYDELQLISYYNYLEALNNSLVSPLDEWEEKLDICYPACFGEKKVFLVGPYLCDLSIIQTIEENNGNIVGDDLTNSKRYFTSLQLPVDIKTKDVYEEVALRNLSRFPSPSMSQFHSIIEKNMEEIKRKEVRGVIFVYQKDCEPHEYIYPLFKKSLDEDNIPSLKIQIENKLSQGHEFDVSIGTFLNMI